MKLQRKLNLSIKFVTYIIVRQDSMCAIFSSTYSTKAWLSYVIFQFIHGTASDFHTAYCTFAPINCEVFISSQHKSSLN
jgi:hypothetical protein